MYYLFGETASSAFLAGLALLIAVALVGITVFSIIYHKYIYPRIYYKQYDPGYQPRCSIILPCKGVPQNFEKNIQSFLHLDYKEYEVLYTVESIDDPCVEIIKKVIDQSPRASLVVAGITSTCSQKNHNMIAAIEAANNPEVYVFADSDIALRKNWLSELLRPLSDPQVTVTTGFRWLYSQNGTLGELSNVYQNILLLTLFTAASFFKDVGLWGGSMAIKKKDFDDLDVKAYWAQTVVDDMSLSRIIMKKNKKSVMVTSCITPTSDALSGIGPAIRWFERQVMFLKAYQKPQWYIALLLVLGSAFYYSYLPVALGRAFVQSKNFFQIGGVAPLIFLAGSFTASLLYPLLGPVPHFFRFMLLQPISLVGVCLAVLKTLFTNTVLWSSFKYKLNFKGEVVSVERM